MDKDKIKNSLYGNPLREFTLFPDCEYLYDGVPCYYLEPVKDTIIDKDKVLIILKESNSKHIVNRISLAPIPLTVNYMDRHWNDSAVNLADGIKVWDFKNDIPPYKILYNGEYFVYTDDKVKGEAPLPVSYISDIQAIRFGYNS